MKNKFLTVFLAAALLLTGCGSVTNPAFTEKTMPETVSEAAGKGTAETGTGTDFDASSAVKILLRDGGTEVSGKGADISASTVTVTKAGLYLLSGSLSEGQIIVDAGKNDTVQLVLDGVEIQSGTSAAVYCKKADKVLITLANGTENVLTNGGSYEAIDENSIDSVIFSKADLTLNGSGSLKVTAGAGHGIVSKDTLEITGGAYEIQSAEHGLTGKDAIVIEGGALNIRSGGDGIHAKNSDDAALGGIQISGGTVTVESDGDAISATGEIQIAGGSFRLTSGGGSEAVEMKPSDAAGGGWNRFEKTETPEPAADTSVSTKGIKADGSLTVLAGTFLLDTADDALHAGGDLQISGGEWDIRTGDDGIHSDANVTIAGGNFRIPYCYEGVEGLTVTVEGGSLDITAVDDGINAAGGMDGSGGFSPPGMTNDKNYIAVNGGSIHVVSDGDCLDSNGSLTLNGGTLDLTCGGHGNTALDCDGIFANNGAEVTTNDGSENGGGFGGHGGMRGDRMPGENGWMGGRRPDGEMPRDGEGPGREFGKRPEPGQMPGGFDGSRPPEPKTV